jgi:dethiobiotin synthetase
MTPQIVFVTGTDTGSGKTVLTALLLQYLRSQGVNALAMKPVCAGSRDDVHLLQSIQGNQLSDDLINPFYYKEPAAPAVAARRYKSQITIQKIIQSIDKVGKQCEMVIVEGAGGLLVPLNGRGHTWVELLKRLRCPVIVAAMNKLGAINHTLLTVDKLKSTGISQISTALINTSDKSKKDISKRTNISILFKLLNKTPVIEVPNLGPREIKKAQIVKGSKKMQKILAQILDTV